MKLKAHHSPVFSVEEGCQYLLHQIYIGLQRTRTWKSVCGSCFCMANFIELAFIALGKQAQILPCYAIAVQDDVNFALGYKSSSCSPMQVDGHVVCLVDQCMLVDFGLKNVQRYGWPDFPSAVACKVTSGTVFPVTLRLDSRRAITWFNDWTHPDTAALLTAHKPLGKKLFKEYKDAARWNSLNILQNLGTECATSFD